MNERVGIFIDGANIFYGLKGRTLDFIQFKEWLAKGRIITEASYFNASQKKNSVMNAFFNHVKKAGFRTYIKQTTLNSFTKKYKQAGIDVYLAVKAMRFMDKFDTFILVSGDYDYVPLIEEMKHAGKNIEIVSFEYAMHPIYERFNYRFVDDYLEEQDGVRVNIEGGK